MTGPAPAAAPKPKPATQPGRTFENPLEGALWAQSKGLCVAPVTAGEKAPPHGPWKLLSTRNKAEILTLAEKYPGSNWLIDCGKSTLGVLDEDVKGDKKGRDTTLMMLVEHGPWPATTVVLTPSGGRHWYFYGEMKTTASALGPDVDTRGVGGYVICPGSIVDGKQYILIEENPFADLPEWINEELKKKREEAGMAVEQVPVVDQDIDTSVAAARSYLSTTAPCIEGQAGDARLLQVAAKVKDIGISETLAVYLISTIFSPRCQPPWDDDDIERKVENAYRYCRENQPGIASPEAMFPEDMSKHPQAVLVGSPLPPPTWGDGFPLPPIPPQVQAPAPGQPAAENKAAPAAGPKLKLMRRVSVNIFIAPPEPQKWILKDWIPANENVLFSGDGGTGKSLLTMQMAFSIGLGLPFLGIETTRTPVLYLACEDKQNVLHQRAHNYMARHGLLGGVEEGWLDFSPMAGKDTMMCVPGAHGVMVAGPYFEVVCNTLAAYPGTLLIIDTIGDVWSGNENDRNDVTSFVKRCLGKLVNNYDCTVLGIGHTSKAKGSEYSGSTAWSSCVRARMLMAKSEDKVHREFYRTKSNYSDAGEGTKHILRWEEGEFVKCADDFDDSAENAAMSHVYDAITHAAAQGAPLSLSHQSPRNLGKIRVCDGEGVAIDKEVKIAAANELISMGRVEFRKGEKFGNGLYPQDAW